MLKRKVGTLIITILLFVLVAVVPHQLGVLLNPNYQEALLGDIDAWFLGLGAILLTGTAVFCIGVVFGMMYMLVLETLR